MISDYYSKIKAEKIQGIKPPNLIEKKIKKENNLICLFLPVVFTCY